MEPLTNPLNKRFTIYPIKYNDIWAEYKKQEHSFWTAEEIDFSKDYEDFKNLSNEKQHVIKMILAFFASMDGIVNLNIEENLLSKITIAEALTAYRFQSMMEGIHNECYSIMIDNIIKDEEEKTNIFNSIKTIPVIEKMKDWAMRWIENKHVKLGHIIIAFACVEGILFSGAFALIYWLKNTEGRAKPFMSGLIKSNELISRDEGLHTDFACLLYKYVNDKPSINDVNEIVMEAVGLAYVFNYTTLKIKLEGMNSHLLNQYSEYIADRLLVQLGYNKLLGTKNPFSFMNTIGMVQKTNFHESRPTEYRKADIGKQNITDITDDF